mgnify:CR=1 FL=1
MVRLLPHIGLWHFNAQLRFNPTMVRLLQGGIEMLFTKESVSIPQWCDCCMTTLSLRKFTFYRFNPTMVRLLLRCAVYGPDGKTCFNPTMVRLLP